MTTNYEINISAEERAWLVQKFTEKAVNYFGERLTSLVLYGSTGRGTPRPDSDIDFLIVIKDAPQRISERNELVRPIIIDATDEFEEKFQKLSPFVSLIAKNNDAALYHSPLYLDMLEDGRILFDRDGFIAKVFDEMRARMKELGSRRIWIGEKWYWELKPDYKYPEIFEI